MSFGEGACIDDSETFENTMKSLEIALVNLRHKLILVSGAIDTGRSSMKKVLLLASHRRCRLTGKYFAKLVRTFSLSCHLNGIVLGREEGNTHSHIHSHTHTHTQRSLGFSCGFSTAT